MPGETLVLGCATSCGLGTCSGTGALRVCDAALLSANDCRNSTDSAAFLSFTSNDCGGGDSCPRGRFVCPASGTISIVPRATFGDFRCDWVLEHRGILPPGGRAPETIDCAPGAPYVVGCAQRCGIGECSGSPELRICDGAASTGDCASGSAPQLQAATSFLSCGCPRRVVACPASGRMTVAPVTSGEELCEWDAVRVPHRAGATEVCSPGQRLVVACAQGCGLGTCAGESFLRVCDGNMTPEQCLAASSSSMWLVEEGGASCDPECPEAALTCPGSGAITVVTRSAWGEDRPYGCDWAVRLAGLGE